MDVRRLFRILLYKSLALSTFAICSGGGAARADSFIAEDVLNLRELPYGLSAWPANKLLTIKSPLIDAPVGYVYIAKSGYKEENLMSVTGDLLLAPFKILGSLFSRASDPAEGSERGRVIANLWVSKQGKCSFHTILQKRFYGDGSDSAASQLLAIRRIDIGAGQEVASAEATAQPAIFRRSEFAYTKCGKNQYSNCPEYSGQQYVLRMDWPLTSDFVRALASMPSKPFKVRYVFGSHTQLAEVADGASVAKIFASCS
jgi:hypothetical protein